MTKKKISRLIDDLRKSRNFVRVAPLFSMVTIDKVVKELESELEREVEKEVQNGPRNHPLREEDDHS